METIATRRNCCDFCRQERRRRRRRMRRSRSRRRLCERYARKSESAEK
jgi:hypothetical protein